jgi:hypothetical protein
MIFIIRRKGILFSRKNIISNEGIAVRTDADIVLTVLIKAKDELIKRNNQRLLNFYNPRAVVTK